MSTGDIDRLTTLLAKLPGLGPRSARRAVLHLIKRRESVMTPLAKALEETAANTRVCSVCGNLDTQDPCQICTDPRRDKSLICVVEDVADLWALERTAGYRGVYHVLGGTLSALEGITPEDLKLPQLKLRVERENVSEVILATSATVDGQTTAHVIADLLEGGTVKLSGLAHGVPVGGELDYLDDGTLSTALRQRRPIG